MSHTTCFVVTVAFTLIGVIIGYTICRFGYGDPRRRDEISQSARRPASSFWSDADAPGTDVAPDLAQTGAPEYNTLETTVSWMHASRWWRFTDDEIQQVWRGLVADDDAKRRRRPVPGGSGEPRDGGRLVVRRGMPYTSDRREPRASSGFGLILTDSRHSCSRLARDRTR